MLRITFYLLEFRFFISCDNCGCAILSDSRTFDFGCICKIILKSTLINIGKNLAMYLQAFNLSSASLLLFLPSIASVELTKSGKDLEKLDLDTCELQDIGTILIQLNSLEELDLAENSIEFSNSFSTENKKINCTLTRCEHVIPFLELTLHQKKRGRNLRSWGYPQGHPLAEKR